MKILGNDLKRPNFMPYKNNEAKNAYMRAWKKKHRLRVSAWNKVYRAKNPKKWTQYFKEWELLNKVRRKQMSRRVPLTCDRCKLSFYGFRKSQNFCSRKCMGLSYRKNPECYLKVFKPLHPTAPKGGRMCAHRFVMEQKLGRLLTKNEIVHHINRNRRDNRPENLMVMSNSEHIKLHHKEGFRKSRLS